MIEVRRDDPHSTAVAALLAEHRAFSHANIDPRYAFVLDAAALSAPGTTFFTAWDGGALAGMGAIKRLDDHHAEVKSMRTASGHQREGVGAAVLLRLIAQARADGLTRLSLETGTSDDYAPARSLYHRFGFVDCAAFADYPVETPYNRYMTLALKEA